MKELQEGSLRSEDDVFQEEIEEKKSVKDIQVPVPFEDQLNLGSIGPMKSVVECDQESEEYDEDEDEDEYSDSLEEASEDICEQIISEESEDFGEENELYEPEPQNRRKSGCVR